MAGNSFGDLFRITTFGESHGPGIGVIIDGTPPGLTITEALIQAELDKRRPGQSDVTTPRKEGDKVEILSGVFEDLSTGTPIALLIRNDNQQSKDYSAIKDLYRPGHADYTFQEKFGLRDHKGGGRSSGRETACRVAAGAIAKIALDQHGISITAYTKSVGDIVAETTDFNEIERNPVRSADAKAADKMATLIKALRAKGDSIGSTIEAVIQGCPAGLGDPVFDKLDAMIAHAIMSIGTIKGIEIGDGFAATTKTGSQNNDEFTTKDGKISTVTNNAGGILGGISNGADIVVRAALKPPSSITVEQSTVTKEGKQTSVQVHGRHDPCIAPRAVPVIEAMLAITILDRLLVQKSIR
ncbi:MAG: chorismate synthase [bacterium]|nr:chorismate synthase [bacterium]